RALRAGTPPAADGLCPPDRGAVAATRVARDVSHLVWHGGCFTPPHGTLAHSPLPWSSPRAPSPFPSRPRLHRPPAPVARRARGTAQRAHLHRLRPGLAGAGRGHSHLGPRAHRRWTHAARLGQLRGALARPRARRRWGGRARARAGGGRAGGHRAWSVTSRALGLLVL